MPERPGFRRPLREDELERALRDVGARIAYPEPPDLAAVIRRLPSRPRSLAAPPGPERGLREGHSESRRARLRRSVLAVAAALTVVVTAALLASPAAREAVAGWLGLPGARIELTPSPPVAPTRTLGEGLRLGERVTIAEARKRVDFHVLLPRDTVLGRPDEVYVGSEFAGGQVFLVYRERPGLPRAAEIGVAVLVSEFVGRVDRELLHKMVGPGGELEVVDVNGRPGFWVEAAEHVVFSLDRNGRVVPDTLRVAGNVLLWQQGNVTLRLESALTKQDALSIASSFA